MLPLGLSSLASGECSLTFYFSQASQMEVKLAAPGVRGSNRMFYFSGSFCNALSVPQAKCGPDVCGKGYELIQGVQGMQCATEVCDPTECCRELPGAITYPKVQLGPRSEQE